MKTLKTILLMYTIISLLNCSSDDSGNNNSSQNGNFENSQRTIANLNTNFFKPVGVPVKGIILLGSGNDAQDPSEGNITDGYLVNMAQEFAKKGFVTAIVAYRDQPYVGNMFQNFNSNAEMLITDFNNVGNALRAEFNLQRNQLIFGGVSYAANVLISKNAYGANAQDIKGVIGIMGSCAQDTAENQKLPVLAFACSGEPFGTHYGSTLVNSITNASVKSKSYGLTDNSCSGHNNSNNWITEAVQKANNWFN